MEQGGGFDGGGCCTCFAATTRGVTILRPQDSAINVSSCLDVLWTLSLKFTSNKNATLLFCSCTNLKSIHWSKQVGFPVFGFHIL